MKSKAKKPDGPNLRQKLTTEFVAALQADWHAHGKEIIEALRTQAPAKYAEILSRLIQATEESDAQDYTKANSMEDIGRMLMRSVGLKEPSDDQISLACIAKDNFIARLHEIAGTEAGTERLQ